MIKMFGAWETVPRRRALRPDENRLLHDGLLAHACKFNYLIKFFTVPTYWSIQTTKLHIPDLLDNVDPPQVLVHDLVVLKPNS